MCKAGVSKNIAMLLPGKHLKDTIKTLDMYLTDWKPILLILQRASPLISLSVSRLFFESVFSNIPGKNRACIMLVRWCYSYPLAHF